MPPYRSYSTPCIFYTKGSCRNGSDCRFAHIDYDHQVKCPEYWTCRYRHCICKHPTYFEKQEHERELAEAARLQAERAKQWREDEERRRIAEVQRKATELANRKARAKALVADLDYWTSIAKQETAKWKLQSKKKLAAQFAFFAKVSPHFAQAIPAAPASSPSKRRRLSNGRFAPSIPVEAAPAHINIDDWDWIKLVWIDYLVYRGLMHLDGDQNEEQDQHDQALIAAYDGLSEPWDADDVKHYSAFRNLFKVLLEYSNLAHFDADEFTNWLEEDLQISTPQTIAPLLLYGFNMSTEEALPIIQRCHLDEIPFDVRDYTLMLQEFSADQVAVFCKSLGEVPIQLVLGLELETAGEFLRANFLDSKGRRDNAFDRFKEGYEEILELLKAVEGTTLFATLYSTTFDGQYSKKHYKAATRQLEEKPSGFLDWEYCDFNEELRQDWIHWNHHNQREESYDNVNDCYLSPDSDDEPEDQFMCGCTECDGWLEKAMLEDEEEDRWWKRNFF